MIVTHPMEQVFDLFQHSKDLSTKAKFKTSIWIFSYYCKYHNIDGPSGCFNEETVAKGILDDHHWKN